MNNDNNINNQASQDTRKTAYKGIQLEDLHKETRLAHSQFFDSHEGVDHLEELFDRDKALLTPEQFERVSALSSVVGMNYQICNGGLEQYYFNECDKEREPFNSQDVKRLDKDAQVSMLKELLDFGREVFPEHELENERLDRVIYDFEHSAYVEEELDEDDFLFGEPDMFLEAPGDFDTRYYEVSDYLENLMEGYAQYLGKAIDLEEPGRQPGQDQSVDELVKEAKERLGGKEASKEPKEKKQPELER